LYTGFRCVEADEPGGAAGHGVAAPLCVFAHGLASLAPRGDKRGGSDRDKFDGVRSVRTLLIGLRETEPAVATVLAARGHVIESRSADDSIAPGCLEEPYDLVVDRWPGAGRLGFTSWATSACGDPFILTVIDGEPAQDIVAALLAGGTDDLIERIGLEGTFEERILVIEHAVFRRLARKRAEAVTVDDLATHLEEKETLRDLAENLSTTLNSIGDGVIACNADGIVIRMNPVAEKLTGWTFGEAKGRPLEEIFKILNGETGLPVESPVSHALREGAAVAMPSHSVLVRRDGSELPIADSCAPIKGADEAVRGGVLVFRDMSAEHRAREREEKSRRQLFLAERMASVGTLAAGAAHEINNPLGYVITNLDVAIEEIQTLTGRLAPSRLDELAEMLRDARNGAERVRQIVRGLKTFSRNEEEPHTALELRPILELAANMAANEIRHRARLVTHFGAVPLVEVDGARLGQVFLNLLINAAQALPDGQSDTNEIRITTSTDTAGRAIVEVEDTGHGIPASVLSRVFDPFFTTKPVGIGTGLGLSISQNIVKGFGGEITIQSKEGSGTIFRVSLPPSVVQDLPRERSRSVRPPAGGIAEVLVVDDEPDLGKAFKRLLRGHSLTLVTRAQAALDLLAAGKTFDIIFSDLMMPEMSGMDFHEEALRRFPGAAERMVFVTGGAFTPAAIAFLARVPNERIEKPFEPGTVRELVRAYSERRKAPFESGTVELRPSSDGELAGAQADNRDIPRERDADARRK
jgi:PAS domain S-box-containing protein